MHTKRQMHSVRSIKMQIPFIRWIMYASIENQYSNGAHANRPYVTADTGAHREKPRKSKSGRINTKRDGRKKEKNPRDIFSLRPTHLVTPTLYPCTPRLLSKCELTRLPSYHCGQIFILRAIPFGSITLSPMDSTSE